MTHRYTRTLICFMLAFFLSIFFLPNVGYAFGGSGTHEEHWEGTFGESNGADESSDPRNVKKNSYKYDIATTIEKMISICQKYSDRSVTTGVRNQINWMKELYRAAVDDFVSGLGLGDTLLLGLLNHSDIIMDLTTSSYSFGDLNREVARKIVNGAAGYADVAEIAKATGLKEKEVLGILERIAAGGITEKTIAVGKNRSRASTHGVYVNTQALKQDKVYKYLTAEVETMAADPESLLQLYNDLGTGYVDSLLSGQDLNKYQIALYKKNLASALDDIADSDTLWTLISDNNLTKNENYKVADKTRSAMSKLYKLEIEAEVDKLSDDLKEFWKEHMADGVLSESDAREYLILSGEYKKGEHGISEAAKQLAAGQKLLEKFEKTLSTTGKVLDTVEELEKACELFDYWADNYAEQEMILDQLVETLSNSDTDVQLTIAAKELQLEYKNKMDGTFDRVYSTLIDKGIGSVKSAFPPLGIAEATISLAGIVTGADDHVKALETGFGMQELCNQALEDYENAVIAVNKGDTSEEALSNVLSTFALAKQSLISYCEAIIELTEDPAQRQTYTKELKRLKETDFGYVTVPSLGK